MFYVLGRFLLCFLCFSITHQKWPLFTQTVKSFFLFIMLVFIVILTLAIASRRGLQEWVLTEKPWGVPWRLNKFLGLVCPFVLLVCSALERFGSWFMFKKAPSSVGALVQGKLILDNSKRLPWKGIVWKLVFWLCPSKLYCLSCRLQSVWKQDRRWKNFVLGNFIYKLVYMKIIWNRSWTAPIIQIKTTTCSVYVKILKETCGNKILVVNKVVNKMQ